MTIQVRKNNYRAITAQHVTVILTIAITELQCKNSRVYTHTLKLLIKNKQYTT